MTMIESILNEKSGVTTVIEPNYIVLSDSLPLEIVNELENIKRPEAPERVIVMLYFDTPAGNFISAEIQKKLIQFARKHELKFVQSQGIGYHILLNQYVKPGDIIVSPGKHNSIFGVEQALGLHVNPSELLHVCTNGKMNIVVPETVYIELTGQLKSEASIKDFVISFLASNELKYAGKAIEFYGEGLNSLSPKETTDLCQLASRSGAVTAFLHTDYQGPGQESYDLGDVQPMVALPGSIHQSQPAAELAGTPLSACFIGGCTGGSIEDLRTAAAILKGKRIPINMRLSIGPQTNEVYKQAISEGLIQTFIDSGAQILSTGCASCVTTSKGVIAEGETMLSASCWNYKGCNGSKDSLVYLASAESVANSALKGCITLNSKG
ncbi:3-isopropylmalate dehydratase [Paenibacillus polymyxa]|uniref:aconitase family protein n=1 Tax=Paenibacillus polymyxa TaxID=1406 RepID=UPI00042F01F4|nr:aconitase family protein [Paenibacillus polymyxa]AHM68063.1 3-isopropylmalate dehydratase large subunit [Paenibacillus polymyxa SQR-21]AIY08765.1 3-isopropylmalate dehydratase [Paenibacillus polymyxa]MBY7738573.1 3-isopropylmalate dehydratase [Paenibacillus polymyxa]RGL37644.1 3-isopropylmalate dehydratase [Paenibacillus polymyxa]